LDTITPKDNVMMICPNLKCRKVLAVPERYRGHQVKCHYCSIVFAVPAAKPRSPAPHPPEPDQV